MCTSQLYRAVTWQDKVEFLKGANIEKFNSQKVKYKELTPIPCGRCAECRMQKAQEWAFRCMKEAQEYKNNVMVTLTYNDENLPIGGYEYNSETGEILTTINTLNKRDVQLFIKRVRKKYGNDIRYYYAGEYGEKRGRPHYHIIFFNLNVEDMQPYKESKCEWSKQKNLLFKSKTMDKLWNKGYVDLNEVNYETCCYVARYVMKKQYGATAEKTYYKTEEGKTLKLPEYTCMSRRPGIGYKFFEKNKDKFENEETFWTRTKKGLKEFRGSRYFDKQIEKEKPELLEAIKEKRKQKSQEHWQDILSKTGLSKEEYIANLVEKREHPIRFLKRTLA